MCLIMLLLLLFVIFVVLLMVVELVLFVQVLLVNLLVIGEIFIIELKVLGEICCINVYCLQLWGLDLKVLLLVFYMFDGGIDEDFLYVVGLVQVFSGNGSMCLFLLVGIENIECCCDMIGFSSDLQDQKIVLCIGGLVVYCVFLCDELMLQVCQCYLIIDECVLIGELLVGLFVVEILLQELMLFNSYIVLDFSLWWNWGMMLVVVVKQLLVVMCVQLCVFLVSSGQLELVVFVVQLVMLLQQVLLLLLVKYLLLLEEIYVMIYYLVVLQVLCMLFLLLLLVLF